jgi:hypothetical protein
MGDNSHISAWRTPIYVPSFIGGLPLSPDAFSLYVRTFLVHRNSKSGLVWTERQTMRRESGIGVNSLSAKLEELKRFGLIEKRKRIGRTGPYQYFVPLHGNHEAVSPKASWESPNREVWESRNREGNQIEGNIKEEEVVTDSAKGPKQAIFDGLINSEIALLELLNSKFFPTVVIQSRHVKAFIDGRIDGNPELTAADVDLLEQYRAVKTGWRWFHRFLTGRHEELQKAREWWAKPKQKPGRRASGPLSDASENINPNYVAV